MTKKLLFFAMLITFISAGSSFASDIDIGENYHMPDGFAMILITSSDRNFRRKPLALAMGISRFCYNL